MRGSVKERVRSSGKLASRMAKSGRDRLRPRTGAKHTVVEYMMQLPRYLRLLGGLLVDPRVAALDKLLVAGAIAYILNPFDLVPEAIPFLGQVDDVYLLGIALQRLVGNAGKRVLLSHWSGSPADLSPASLQAVVSAAAFFLPRGVGRRLRHKLAG
jgi:uncharacterized membrane protein YkvA (DUF1232 family)